jgi:hypothetical protein
LDKASHQMHTMGPKKNMPMLPAIQPMAGALPARRQSRDKGVTPGDDRGDDDAEDDNQMHRLKLAHRLSPVSVLA